MTCPHCNKKTVLELMPEGYATKRWGGTRKEEPYVRCPLCTATFPARAFPELVSPAQSEDQ